MTKNIRVVVVDDHTLMRQGLVGLLDENPDIVVVGQSGDAAAALDVIEATKPDVVLMDVGLPGVSGLQLTARVKRAVPDTQVLVVTMYEREDYLFEALRAGASGYVLKGADIKDLLTAVRTVAQGEMYLYRDSFWPDPSTDLEVRCKDGRWAISADRDSSEGRPVGPYLVASDHGLVSFRPDSQTLQLGNATLYRRQPGPLPEPPADDR